MEKIVYRNYESKDFESCLTLIKDTFTKYCKETFVDEMTMLKFWDIMTPNNPRIVESFQKYPYQFIAELNWIIVGVLRWNNEKLLHLFVKENFHGNWIASQLMNIYESKLRESWIKYIKLNASQNAISYYQKKWFKKTTGIRHKKWMKAQPMKKILI